VEPLCSDSAIRVVVVDNASTDDSLASIDDLPLERVQLADNRGFAVGCNVGWKRGSSPYVLFLNPDARIDIRAAYCLVRVLEEQPAAGLAAPVIFEDDGSTAASQRRFLRLTTIWAQALFVHKILVNAGWANPMVEDPAAYERTTSPEWVSGACMLLRRSTLERLNGFDERFFMYCEDMDLCRRLRNLGLDVVFEPRARVTHISGASAPWSAMHPVLTESRVRYIKKHFGRGRAFSARAGVAVGELARIAISRGGRHRRATHVRSLRVALAGRQPRPIINAH
jgi:hypothetical protein